jgi:hypothetical protein
MIDKPSPTDVATLRQDYDNLRRRQEALAKRMPAAFAVAVRRAYKDRKPIPPKTKLFDKPSLITRRIAKGDHSEAAWTKLKNETVRLLRAQGGNPHQLKKRLRAGLATPAEMALAADLWAVADGTGERKRGRPKKLSDTIARETASMFLTEALTAESLGVG